MARTKSVRAVLGNKGRDVFWLPPDASVYEAVETMATRSIGAVLVLEDGKLVGILSERDYARKVILKGRSSRETLIKEIMSSPVTFVDCECTIDQAMALMTEKRIRHLPVIAEEQVVGVVSIGDLVKFIVNDQAATIDHLHAYITGQYPR
ncbi:MAG: CBS domain-containing protein [Bryobacteraceae bacterium]|nr:CBS domain-containing protein [Bryobacteraceae bacterium]